MNKEYLINQAYIIAYFVIPTIIVIIMGVPFSNGTIVEKTIFIFFIFLPGIISIILNIIANYIHIKNEKIKKGIEIIFNILMFTFFIMLSFIISSAVATFCGEW